MRAITRHLNSPYAALLILIVVSLLAAMGLIPPLGAGVVALAGIVYSEANRLDDIIKYELNPTMSRDIALVLSGQNLLCGAVCGAQLVGATGTATINAGNVGNGVMGAVTVGTGAKRGRYTLQITTAGTNAGEFNVYDPDDRYIAQGTVGVAFNALGLQFTLADGATDFVAGDGFAIDVTGGVYKAVAYDPTSVTGAQNFFGILLFKTDASATGTNADTNSTFLTRGPAVIVNANLVYAGGVTAAQKAILEQDWMPRLGIISRASA
jgi:hypothetical protein